MPWNYGNTKGESAKMHTFEGEGCRIYFNSDLSGMVQIEGGPGDDGRDELISIPGSDLLALFAHLQEPGGCLAQKWNEEVRAELTAQRSPTPAAIMREQIKALRLRQREPVPVNREESLKVAALIGELAERLHRVESEAK